MIYKCKKDHPRLTVGKYYDEIASNPNAYNAFVWSDDAEPEYFPRDEFFEVV